MTEEQTMDVVERLKLALPRQVVMDEAAAEIERLRVAIRWALGEGPDAYGHWFGDLSKYEHYQPYWWRTNLRQIAGMGDQRLEDAK